MRTSPTSRRTMVRVLLPNFMWAGAGERGSGLRLSLQGDDVEEQRERHQRDEEDYVLWIDDALRERVEVSDEAEVRERVREYDGQHALQGLGETAEPEEQQHRTNAEAEHEAD